MLATRPESEWTMATPAQVAAALQVLPSWINRYTSDRVPEHKRLAVSHCGRYPRIPIGSKRTAEWARKVVRGEL